MKIIITQCQDYQLIGKKLAHLFKANKKHHNTSLLEIEPELRQAFNLNTSLEI